MHERGKSPSDQSIVAQLRLRDVAAFEQLMRVHYDALHNYAARLLHSADAADDVLQDVFLRVWTHAESFSPNGPIRVYLLGAVRNTALNAIKKSRTSVRRDLAFADFASNENDIVGEIERDELTESIGRAVHALPSRCREIWVLSREVGLSNPEIAQVTGVSINTVKTQLGRALTAIRRAAMPFLVLALTHKI